MGRIITLPFAIVGGLVRFALALMGRLASLVIGFLMVIGGVLLSLTGIGAVVGVPLVIFGGALIIKGVLG